MKRRWFAYDPNDDLAFFATEEEAANRAREMLEGYADVAMSDGWDEDVEFVCYGKVTHAAMRINEITPVGEIDEDGIDEDSVYWESGIDFKCDYEIKKVGDTE